MHDGDLSFTSCDIIGPGYILATGDIIIKGNTTISGGVKILSEKNISTDGTSTIGSSLSDYSVLYGKAELASKAIQHMGWLLAEEILFHQIIQLLLERSFLNLTLIISLDLILTDLLYQKTT